MKLVGVVSAVLLLCSGCGLEMGGVVSQQVFSLDAVKLLSTEYTDGNDPATFDQPQYELGSTRNLLLRFEGLGERAKKVDVSPGHSVLVKIGIESEAAATKLRLCPMTRTWMMLATWEYAHPFNQNGKWTVKGGDYDAFGCVTGALPAPRAVSEPLILTFDVTSWVVNYVRGRLVNHGLVLIADEKTTVAGERSGSYSPRIIFDQIGM